MKMRGLVYAIALLLLSGCAITKEGLVFPSDPPTREQAAQQIAQLESNARSAGVRIADPAQPLLVYVGATGVHRPIGASDMSAAYARYRREARGFAANGSKLLSEGEFERVVTGWTTVAIHVIPGFSKQAVEAYIPNELQSSLNFPSGPASYFWGATGDLVVAMQNRDGSVFVRAVLCRKDADYAACAERYVLGVFDGATGQQVHPRWLRPKKDGSSIDLKTYEMRTTH